MSDIKTQDSGNNLDILGVPNEEISQLATHIENFYKQDGIQKIRLTKTWERNRKFVDGDQWLVFNDNAATGSMWSNLKPSRANEYIPRPVTNYMFDGYQTLKSYLMKVKPRSTVFPKSQDFQDKSAAKIAELVLETNWERLKEQENYEYAAACLLTDGTVFKKSWWDTSTNTTVKVPRMVPQPQVDPNTGIPIGTVYVEEVDENGNTVYDFLNLGDVATSIVEASRIAIDPLCTGLHDAKWIIEYSLQKIGDVKQNYAKQEEGYTGAALELTEESGLSSSMSRFWGTKNSAGGVGGGVGISANRGASDELTNFVVVKDYYERPTEMHPHGRRIVVANNKTLYVKDNDPSSIDMGDWHPFSECRWEIMSGRFWGKSPCDDACDIQKRVNSIDSAIILTRKTMAMPQKILPAGSGLSAGEWTGRPGQVLTYRTDAGAKPEIIPGISVDQSVFAERAQCVEDIKNIMGAIDILKGDRPAGVNAASALSLLYEVGTGKLFPILDRWKRFIENDQKKQLKLTQTGYKEPRPDFIAALKAKNREISKEAIEKFIGTDLYDNCNVVIEAGSNVPKLQSVAQMRLQEAAQSGTLNLDAPENRMEYNRQMGIIGFDNDVEPDVLRQEWENDLIENIENNPSAQPVVMDFDQDDIHVAVLEKRMKEPSWMELPFVVQQAYMRHREEHLNAKNQKEAQMLEQQSMMGSMAPPPPAGPAPARSQGKGIPAAVKSGLSKQDMPPNTIVS